MRVTFEVLRTTPPRPLGRGRKAVEPGVFTHAYDVGRLVDHLLNDLSPPPSGTRIHPRQDDSDVATARRDRKNVVYEIFGAGDARGGHSGPASAGVAIAHDAHRMVAASDHAPDGSRSDAAPVAATRGLLAR